MRPITRNAVIGILVVVVLLLALGALPSLLKSGDPYYVSAEPVEDRPAVNVTGVSERQFPFATAAIEQGESEPYWRGPTGLKESFTHSPFDELRALDERDYQGTGANREDMSAVDPEQNVAYVEWNGTVYRLEVEQRAE